MGQALSGRCDLTVLTYRKRDRPSAADTLPGTRVVEWVEPPLIGRNERFNSLLKPGYLPFYLRVRRWVRHALASGEVFDVAHQPVPVGLRYPTPLATLGIPYVLGPVGGGLASPPGFEHGDTAPWYVALRRTDRWRLTHDPMLRRGFANAGCVLGIAPYVAQALSGVPLRRLELMSETALESLPDPVDRSARTAGPVRLLFVGRLVRTKGARDAVAAMAHLADLDVELEVIGDGFDREECERTARELGVAHRVSFRGQLPHAQVEAAYRQADIFLFPSYREPGGNVAFEAMGHQLPLIVSDRGGPASAVDEHCGIRVHASNPTQYAEELARAVRLLVNDAPLRLSMGRAARSRVHDIGLWDAKATVMLGMYDEVRTSHGGPRRT